MKMIKLIAGTIGMTVSLSTMAVGYSSVDNPVSGDLPANLGAATTGVAPPEQHIVQSYTTPGTCGGVCQASELQESEVIIQLNVTNQSGCVNTGAGGGGAKECIGTATTDYYTGNADGGGSNYTGSGNPAAQVGATPSISHLQIFGPYCSTPGTTCFTWLDLGTAGLAAFSMLEWDFNTAVNGKITDGHLIGSAMPATTNIVGTFNFNSMVFTTYYGSNAEAQSSVDCLVDTPSACQTGTFLLSRSFGFEYVTAGMAQLDLGKAVPVPAFAAAALGLGLVGITLLTGRRRQIK